MDIGIAGYRPGLEAIAQAAGAKWARVSYNPFREAPPAATMAHAWDNGMKSILNCEGALEDLCGIIVNSGDTSEWDKALQRYIDGILPATQIEHLTEIEIWGCNAFPSIAGGKGPQYDYSRILHVIRAAIRAEREDIRILTGGWGINADIWFLQFGLARHAQAAFDVANMHPLVIPQTDCPLSVGYQQTRLQEARRVLDKDLTGQPLCASAWGVPTVECAPPPEWGYGEYFELTGGVHAITYENAVEWYKAFLTMYKAEGLQFVCIVAEDDARYETWTDFCGLCLPGGEPKPGLTDPLLCWLSEEWATYYAPEDNDDDEGEIFSAIQ